MLLMASVYSLLLEDFSSVVVDNTQLPREFPGRPRILFRGNNVLTVEIHRSENLSRSWPFLRESVDPATLPP
jgi:hypothetical protein